VNGPLPPGVSAGSAVGSVLPMEPASGPTRVGAVPAGPSGSPEVAVNRKKFLVWLAVAFVVFYVIQRPEASADMVKNAGEALGSAASSIAAFVGSLV
jgi:hypothetical protein